MAQTPIVQSEKLNHGAVAVEQSRAITEAQAKYYFAKQYPRDEIAAHMKVMDSCKRISLAETACYSFPRGKETVSGPSIRLAEEIARCWGNIDYGIRELSNADGESEMEAFAIDLETNTVSRQTFKVRHIRDSKFNSQELTNQRDIYELTANMGARRLRARILAILPPDIVEDAVKQCRDTIKGGGKDKPMADRIKDLLAAFKKHSVNRDMIERRLGHDIEALSEDELVDLRGIFNSLNNAQSKRADWFQLTEDEAPPALTTGKGFNPGKPAAQEVIEAPANEAPPLEEGDPFA